MTSKMIDANTDEEGSLVGEDIIAKTASIVYAGLSYLFPLPCGVPDTY